MDGGPLCARWTLILDARHALDLLAWTPTFHPPTCNACLAWPHGYDIAKRCRCRGRGVLEGLKAFVIAHSSFRAG
jgi:hypothetical protein